MLELLRAQSYTMDRLVLWELETFVTDLSERLGLDDTSARLVALDRIDGLVELLERQLTYVWRRHMASILGRTDAEVSTRGREDTGPTSTRSSAPWASLTSSPSPSALRA